MSTAAPTLVLASRSPRRALLLTQAGYTFSQTDPPFADPPHPPEGNATDVAREIALAKIHSLLSDNYLRNHPACVVLTADTLIAYPDGTLAGTPIDRQQARAMLERFRSATHDVVTAIALAGPGSDAPVQAFVDVARVRIGYVTDEQIEVYLAGNDWRGKAGGYNLFERQAAGWPITVTGDPTTVVGLPMPVLIEQLNLRGIVPRVKFQTKSTHA